LPLLGPRQPVSPGGGAADADFLTSLGRPFSSTTSQPSASSCPSAQAAARLATKCRHSCARLGRRIRELECTRCSLHRVVNCFAYCTCPSAKAGVAVSCALRPLTRACTLCGKHESPPPRQSSPATQPCRADGDCCTRVDIETTAPGIHHQLTTEQDIR
jgi:hypothetical protein